MHDSCSHTPDEGPEDRAPEGSAPLVSVLMAAYNEEEGVREAARSILTQTVSDLELVVVDDGSTDRTPEFLRSIGDERLRLFFQEENQGRSAARNCAIEQARGRYVAFMDADDVSHPRRLETQLQFLEASPEIDVCGTALETFGGKRKETWRPPLRHERLHAQLLFECPFFLPTALLRRDVLEKPRIRFDPMFQDGEDYDFWVRLVRHARLANLEEVLYQYRYDWEARKTDRKKKSRESTLIQKRQLQALGLEPTPRQFQLHSAMSKPVGYTLQSRKDVTALIRWLDRLLSQNRKKNIYSQEALTETIEQRLDEILAPVPGRRLGQLHCLDSKIVRRRLLRKIRRSTEGLLPIRL